LFLITFLIIHDAAEPQITTINFSCREAQEFQKCSDTQPSLEKMCSFLTGRMQRNPKYPILARGLLDNLVYKFSVDQVKEVLERKRKV